MSGEVNWKLKYQELKSKYMNAVDMAFRLGAEEGMKQAGLDNANNQLAQAQASENDAPPGEEGGPQNNNSAPGVPAQGGEGADKSGAPSIQPKPVEPAAAPMAESEHPGGSELDQHIEKLEGMLAKAETDPRAMDDLPKYLESLKDLQKSMKLQFDLKKSAQAIPRIAQALHKPQFKVGVQAQHNLSSTAKAAVTMQHDIVSTIMQKWEAEEKKASKDIMSTLNIDGITKGE